MVLLTVVLYWLLTDDSFRVSESSVRFEGLRYADEATVRDLLSGLDREPNVFRVRTSEIVERLSTLPEVDAATARVTLPADVAVELDERDPIFIWTNGKMSWLVDAEGMLFSPSERGALGPASASDVEATATTDVESTPQPSRTEVEQGSARPVLPVVEDDRLFEEVPTERPSLSATDFEVMRYLLAITPEMLGSHSTELHLRVDEKDGYVLSGDRPWVAVFGHYTPTIQPPEVIPLQVQCLAAALAAGENKLTRVRLAVSDEACGTFTKHE